jgi:hypothetical protein
MIPLSVFLRMQGAHNSITINVKPAQKIPGRPGPGAAYLAGSII